MSFTFLRGNYLLFLFSVSLGLLLLPLFNIASNYILKYKTFFNLRSVKFLFILIAIIFLFFGYLTKPVYYSPKTIGTLGDDYFQMSDAIKEQGIMLPQHIMKPYIIEKFIILGEKMGFLNKSAPLYLERSVLVASLPIRVLTMIGLLLIFATISIFFGSFYLGLLFFFFTGTSFAVWAWGIMHNSIGAAIAMTMITYCSAIYFFKKTSYFRASLFGVITGLCVFTHSSIGYFCLGVFFYMIYWLLSGNDINIKAKLKYFIVFCAGASFIAVFYYYVLASHFGFWNIVRFINFISDGGYATNILSVSSLKRIYSSIMQFSLNLFNVWQPKNIFESFLIMLQISGLTSCVVLTVESITRLKYKKNFHFLLLFVFPCFTIISGFIFLKFEFYHYLDIGVVSFILFLLFSFFLFNEEVTKRIKIILSLSMVVVSFFVFNVFSSHNVFIYRDVNSLSIYANYNVIYEKLKNDQKQKAIFLTYDEYQSYFYKGMQAYYKKFANIERISDFPKTRIDFVHYVNILKDKDFEIFLNNNVLNDIGKYINLKKYQLLKLSDQVFYLKIKKG